jgi:hypothetical protein
MIEYEITEVRVTMSPSFDPVDVSFYFTSNPTQPFSLHEFDKNTHTRSALERIESFLFSPEARAVPAA